MSDHGAEPPEHLGDGSSEGAPLPSSIANAVTLMWAGAALEVVARVWGLATGAYIGDDAPARTPLAGVVAGAVVTFVLWAWMALTNSRGQAWARVVATILGGIGIIRALSGFFVIGAFGGGVVGLMCSMILAALAVTILVLLWTKESTDFYNREFPEL